MFNLSLNPPAKKPKKRPIAGRLTMVPGSIAVSAKRMQRNQQNIPPAIAQSKLNSFSFAMFINPPYILLIRYINP